MFYLKYIQFLNCKRMSYIPCKSFKYCKLGQNKYWGGGVGVEKTKRPSKLRQLIQIHIINCFPDVKR